MHLAWSPDPGSSQYSGRFQQLWNILLVPLLSFICENHQLCTELKLYGSLFIFASIYSFNLPITGAFIGNGLHEEKKVRRQRCPLFVMFSVWNFCTSFIFFPCSLQAKNSWFYFASRKLIISYWLTEYPILINRLTSHLLDRFQMSYDQVDFSAWRAHKVNTYLAVLSIWVLYQMSQNK